MFGLYVCPHASTLESAKCEQHAAIRSCWNMRKMIEYSIGLNESRTGRAERTCLCNSVETCCWWSTALSKLFSRQTRWFAIWKEAALGTNANLSVYLRMFWGLLALSLYSSAARSPTAKLSLICMGGNLVEVWACTGTLQGGGDSLQIPLLLILDTYHL